MVDLSLYVYGYTCMCMYKAVGLQTLLFFMESHLLNLFIFMTWLGDKIDEKVLMEMKGPRRGI